MKMGRGIGGMFVRRGGLVLFLGEGYTWVEETKCWKMGTLVGDVYSRISRYITRNAHNQRAGVSVIGTC
jgi:hypothetical protein